MTTSVFFHEFSDYLESLVMCNELLLIHGHTLDLIITRQADDIVDGEPLP